MPSLKKRIRTREDNLRAADLHRLRVLHERVVAAKEKVDRMFKDDLIATGDYATAISWYDHLRKEEEAMIDRIKPQRHVGGKRHA
jgi:cell division inhibitor SulA